MIQRRCSLARGTASSHCKALLGSFCIFSSSTQTESHVASNNLRDRKHCCTCTCTCWLSLTEQLLALDLLTARSGVYASLQGLSYSSYQSRLHHKFWRIPSRAEMTQHAPPQPGLWSSSLCGCCCSCHPKDCGTCWLTIFCPCCSHGKLHARVHKDDGCCGSCTCYFIGAPCCVPWCILGPQLRESIRSLYGLPEGCGGAHRRQQ